MVEAGSIWFRLGLNTDDLRFGIDKAKYSMLEWRNETNAHSGDMLKWGAAIGATIAPVLAAGYAVNALTQKYGAQAQQLKDLSYQTGISTDYLQRLQYAATLSDTEFGTVSFGINKLTLNMGQFANGSKEARDAFALVGVTPTGKPVDMVFEEIANAVTDNIDPTQRAAAAVALFGRNGKEMLPFVDEYIKNLEKIKNLSTLTSEELESNIQAKVIIDDTGKKWENTEAKMLSYFTKLFGKWDESLDRLRSTGGNSSGNLSAIDRFIFGMSESVGNGAERSPWVNSATIDAAVALTDKYSGLTEEGLKYQLAIDEITDSQNEMDAAMEGKDQKAFDDASKRHQQAILDFQKLREEMGKTAEASTSLSKTISSDWVGKAVGEQGFDSSNFLASGGSQDQWNLSGAGEDSAMYQFMRDQQAKGSSYQDALNKWGYEGTAAKIPKAGETGTSAATLGATTISDISDPKKTPLFGTKEITKTAEEELDKQEKLYSSFFTSIQTGLVETSKLQAKYWENLTGNQAAALTSMSASDAQFTKFVAENPTIKNIGVVVWTKEGADWDPTKNDMFMQAARVNAILSNLPQFTVPTFKAISMTGIAGTGSYAGIPKKEQSGDETSAKDKTTKVEVTVTLENTPEATRVASQNQYSYITGGG
ncbi:MAG: hypothetical protein ACYDDV_00400 [Methanoregula sp.]